MIQITIFCGSCQQQVSAVVLPNKGNAVADHLHSALASIHASKCYEEASDGRQDKAVADSGASPSEDELATDPEAPIQ